MSIEDKIIQKYVEKIKNGEMTLEDVPPLYIDKVREALENE